MSSPSRAILQYLANAYSKSPHLYPEDPVLRAQVEHHLYFDMGTLYARFAAFAVSCSVTGQFAHGQFAQINEKIKLKKPNLAILTYSNLT